MKTSQRRANRWTDGRKEPRRTGRQRKEGGKVRKGIRIKWRCALQPLSGEAAAKVWGEELRLDH